ncbi:MAG: hypothetical protein ACOWWO_18110 [Peptococcaceae bacterium]
MDEVSWETRVPIFKNSLILKQIGIAIGLPFGALLLLLAAMRAYYALLLIGMTLLLAFLLVLLLFRGTYDVRYTLDRKGVSCQTQERQKKRVRGLAAVTFLFGLLRANPTAAGAGLLSASGTDIQIPWKKIRKVKYTEKQRTIQISGGFGENIALFCTELNYEQVKEYIQKQRGDV